MYLSPTLLGWLRRHGQQDRERVGIAEMPVNPMTKVPMIPTFRAAQETWC